MSPVAPDTPDHVVPQPGVRLVIGPALDADERTRAIADFLAEHPIGLSAATSAGSDSEGRVAKRTAKGRVPGIAQMLSAGSDWIDQYASPLGKRKHLRLCREGVLPCRKD